MRLSQAIRSVTDLRSAQFKKLEGFEFNLSSKTAVSLGVVSIGGIGTTGSGTAWQKITATSGFTSESESTTLQQRELFRPQMEEA